MPSVRHLQEISSSAVVIKVMRTLLVEKEGQSEFCECVSELRLVNELDAVEKPVLFSALCKSTDLHVSEKFTHGHIYRF